jgi:hypothetical protein
MYVSYKATLFYVRGVPTRLPPFVPENTELLGQILGQPLVLLGVRYRCLRGANLDPPLYCVIDAAYEVVVWGGGRWSFLSPPRWCVSERCYYTFGDSRLCIAVTVPT